IQLIEQRLRFLQIECIEALGEPAVYRSEEIAGFALAALLPHQPRIARRGPQLPRFRLLFSRPVERGDVGALRAFGVALERQQLGPDAQCFGIIMPLLPTRPFDLGDALVDQNKRPREITSLGHALGQKGSKTGTAAPTTALLPDTDAPFEQSRPFSALSPPDQPDSRMN